MKKGILFIIVVTIIGVVSLLSVHEFISEGQESTPILTATQPLPSLSSGDTASANNVLTSGDCDCRLRFTLEQIAAVVAIVTAIVAPIGGYLAYKIRQAQSAAQKAQSAAQEAKVNKRDIENISSRLLTPADLKLYELELLSAKSEERRMSILKLIQYSYDPDPFVRWESVRILSKIADYPEVGFGPIINLVIVRLREMVEDRESQAVIMDAERALKKFGVDPHE